MSLSDAIGIARFVNEPTALGFLAAATGTRDLLTKLTRDGKFIEERDELFRVWVVEHARLLADLEQRFSAHERAEYERRTADDEFVAVTANYYRAAHEEPLRERRRMLQFAAAGIGNLSLSVSNLARVQRAIRFLDPEDVIALHSIWLIPSRQPGAHPEHGRAHSAGHLRHEFWRRSGAEALESSGCVVIRTGGGGGAGEPMYPEVRVTGVGQTLRTAMLPYIRAIDPDMTGVPGHEVTPDFRTKEEVEEVISGLPGVRDALRLARSCGSWLQFSSANIALGAPHNAKTSLDFDVPEEQAQCLGPAEHADSHREMKELYRLIVSGIAKPDNGLVRVQVSGPHDVLRHLAYEFDAYWS